MSKETGAKTTAKKTLESNVVGRTATCRPGLEHCWKLKTGEPGEIVACWFNAEQGSVRVAVKGPNGVVEEMGLMLINLDT